MTLAILEIPLTGSVIFDILTQFKTQFHLLKSIHQGAQHEN
jgi:hypothetical protein